MADRLDSDLKARAAAHLEHLRSSGLLANKATDQWKVLELLYQSWLNNPSEALTADQIATSLRWGSLNSDVKVRQLVAELRKNHAAYLDRNRDSVAFYLPKLRGYQLEVHQVAAKPEQHVPIVFEHRGKNPDLLQTFFCEPSDDLLFVSISPDKILDRLTPWFKEGRVKAARVRALIWQPSSPDVVAALALHLGQIPTDFQENIEKAWDKWNALARQHPFLLVHGYQSVPTMNGIVTSNLIQVELLPFNDPRGTEQGTHAKRPALLLNPTDTPVSFHIFQNAFNDLWKRVVRTPVKT
jgi:hypothetical protein